MVKKISLFLCILLMTGCVNLDNRSRMNAYFANMIMNERQKGATELIKFKTDDGESTNTVPTFNFSSDTKEVSFSFETPYSWYVDKSTLADWVSLSRTSGKAGVVELTIEVQDNLSYDERNAVIDIKSGDFTYHIRIYQKGNDASVDLAEDADNIYVKVTPANPEVKEAVGIIPVDDVMSSSKPAVIEIEGIGNFTFDNDAKASILANAEAEGATSVYFKIEDVTTTKPVPDADVVLEVTMKTVDENGVEVYNEVNAAGEVTIEIPMDENVAYVHRVTLVNDAGEPVEGGVVPGSEKIENGVLIFKVNHFSKYAIDYVTKADFVSVTAVSLDVTSVKLKLGDTYSLEATIDPDNATNKKVTWSSSDESVATVDASGKITTVAAGEAIITVTTEDGAKTATCTVTVTDSPVSEMKYAKAVYSEEGGAHWEFTMSETDSYSGYPVLIVKVGPAYSGEFIEGEFNIISAVLKESASDITNYNVGTVTVTCAESGSGTSKYDYDIKTKDASNNEVELIVSGLVTTAKDAVGGNITLKDKSASDPDYKAVTDISFPNDYKPEVAPGVSTQLSFYVNPDATNPCAYWTSSDPSVATVDATGKVTGVGVGTATITATSVDGKKTATCTITVKEITTMADLLGTDPDIPAAVGTDTPSNAWISSENPNCKAFVGTKDGERYFILVNETDNTRFKLSLDSVFEMIDESTFEYSESGVGTFTIKMKENVITSLDFQPENGGGYETLVGSYASSNDAGSSIEDFNVKNDDSDNWN